MQTLEGVAKSDVTHLIQSIWQQTGTPQNPVDWSEPDKWIAERLSGENAALAAKIWQQSGHVVNPRHIYGTYLFINTYDLLVPDAQGIYRLSERGKGFLDEDPATVQALDETEGLLKLLNILATKTQAKRGDLLPEWAEYLQEHSKFTTPSTFKDTLSRRLANLVERGLVAREGNRYTITEVGLEYAEKSLPEGEDPRLSVLRAVNEHNARQREALRELLAAMQPYHFEHLIGDLMEAMGYEDVTVTKQSGDKGVDVVATVQFGITTVREVVQVKRHSKASIPRQTIDQLRGSLPYHQAIRGTLITLGKISKGATEAALFPGAAPITLIDGERLLDLLIEHGIGIKKRPVELWEVDAAALEKEIEAEMADKEVVTDG
ncbi:restriction endonuclease [endosymbiont of unidentified scaly snail isolate Monju]|uniref:restriction endonuclease n=1 Tax=endosymbiont of unidentified scaly snail isolate Monju TaxID=1248727 RepID=UPI0038B5551F